DTNEIPAHRTGKVHANMSYTEQSFYRLSFRVVTPALIILLFSLPGFSKSQVKTDSRPLEKLFLRKGWSIQSSAKVTEKGDAISQNTFQPKNWYPAVVPSTVVGTLVDDKVYPDPFVGMNLRLIPGCSYPIGSNFSLQPMPDDSPFRSSWWYRTEFHLPPGYRGEITWLHLDGINFRANIWLNGKQIANS